MHQTNIFLLPIANGKSIISPISPLGSRLCGAFAILLCTDCVSLLPFFFSPCDVVHNFHFSRPSAALLLLSINNFSSFSPFCWRQWKIFQFCTNLIGARDGFVCHYAGCCRRVAAQKLWHLDSSVIASRATRADGMLDYLPLTLTRFSINYFIIFVSVASQKALLIAT